MLHKNQGVKVNVIAAGCESLQSKSGSEDRIMTPENSEILRSLELDVNDIQLEPNVFG